MQLPPKFALLFFAPALVAPMNAEIIATEYFNGYGTSAVYTGGLSGGTGWTSNWSASDASYCAGCSLSVQCYWLRQLGQLVRKQRWGRDRNGKSTDSPSTSFRTFNDGDASTIWFSALISMNGSDRAVLWIDATGPTPNNFVGVLDGQIAMRYNNGTRTPSEPWSLGGQHQSERQRDVHLRHRPPACQGGDQLQRHL